MDAIRDIVRNGRLVQDALSGLEIVTQARSTSDTLAYIHSAQGVSTNVIKGTKYEGGMD
jgi:hypothetical protein